MPKLDNLPPIIVSSNNEYFLAVCKGNIHSFVCIGITCKNSHESFILSSAGKVFNLQNTSLLKANLNLLFDEAEAHLYPENWLWKNDNEVEVEYKAYSLTEKQYYDYINLIKAGRKAKKNGINDASEKIISYLKSDSSSHMNNSSVIFKPYRLINLNEPSVVDYKKIEKYKKVIHKSSLTNTCRHATVFLAETALSQEKNLDISNLYFRSFPYKTKIENRKFTLPIYILPIPPSKDMPREMFRIANKLYKRLEHLPQRYNQENEITLKKFEALKLLYLSVCQNKNQSLNEIINSCINPWEKNNAALIDTHRSFSFFRETKSRQLIKEIKNLNLKNNCRINFQNSK